MKNSLALDRMLMGQHWRSVKHGRTHRECALLCVAYSFSSIIMQYKEQPWPLLTLTELLQIKLDV